MKMLLLLLALPVMSCGQHFVKQNTEKTDSSYGEQLYSEDDLRQLKKTADSINFSFLQCTRTPEYYSLLQTSAQYVRLKYKKDSNPIQALLKQGVTLNEIIARFPEIEEKNGRHVVLVFEKDYDWEKETYTDVVFSGDGKGFARTSLGPASKNKKAGDWLFTDDDEKDDSSYGYLEAWRLDQPFRTALLPEEFGKMIQYADCMIDTATVLMLEKGPEREEENKPFETLKNHLIVRQQKKTDTTFYIDLEESDLEYMRENYHRDAVIRRLLHEAVVMALGNGNGSAGLELMAEGFYSKDTILLMKRSRVVVGSCSMDPSPRLHARDIAVLAAQTHQWPVFIRAHLNIMNDRFERMTDGSYAEPGRETYLRELEILNIPARELLLGTILTAQNLPEQHYSGKISRIGRAFTESPQSALFEQKIKSYLKDERLDAVNKILLFMLYANYCYQQPDQTVKTEKIAGLTRESPGYPDFIQAGILSLKEY